MIYTDNSLGDESQQLLFQKFIEPEELMVDSLQLMVKMISLR